MTTPAPGRAVCICGRHVHVTLGGLLTRHQPVRDGKVVWGEHCPGSAQPPARDDDEGTATDAR